MSEQTRPQSEDQDVGQERSPLQDVVRVPYLLQIEEKYYQVMESLRKLKLPHGKCFPREDKACTHCMAAEKLLQLQADYKGRPVRLS